MQHTNKGGVEGTGTSNGCMAASHLWRDTNALRTTLSRPVVEARQHPCLVVAVHPNTVTYEFLSGGQSVTQSLDVFPRRLQKAAALT